MKNNFTQQKIIQKDQQDYSNLDLYDQQSLDASINQSQQIQSLDASNNQSQQIQSLDASNNQSQQRQSQDQDDNKNQSGQAKDNWTTEVIVQCDSRQAIKQYLRDNLKQNKKNKFLRNIVNLLKDVSIKLLQDLQRLIQSKQDIVEIQKHIHRIIPNINSMQSQINSQTHQHEKIERNFQKFASKIYDNNNVYNILAQQLICNMKTKSIDKLRQYFIQLSKDWINLLDFSDKEYYQYLKEFLNCLNNSDYPSIKNQKDYFNKFTSNYNKCNFLEISKNLLQIIEISFDFEVDQRQNLKNEVFKLLDVVLEIKFNKYTQKATINFTRKVFEDIFSQNEREINNEIKEEILNYIKLHEYSPQGLKRIKLNEYYYEDDISIFLCLEDCQQHHHNY